MAKQIITKNAIFKMYTEAERQETFSDYLKNSNSQKVNSTAIVTIKKVKYYDELVAVEKNGYTYPLKKFQNEVKKGKQYKIYLNEYEKVIKLEAI